jgi:voltage-gated potassium channel
MLRKFLKPFRRLLKFFTSPLFLYLAIIGNLALIIATLAFYYLERGANPSVQNFFDSFWWGVTTITTVGFGDVVPTTVGGRVIGIILMYSGTILFISFTGFLVHYWIGETVEKEIAPLEEEVEEEEEIQIRILNILNDIKHRLDRLEKRGQED